MKIHVGIFIIKKRKKKKNNYFSTVTLLYIVSCFTFYLNFNQKNIVKIKCHNYIEGKK